MLTLQIKGGGTMKKKAFLISISVLVIAVALICVMYLFTCPKNPDLNTAITTHGNTDWHIDTAEEFLTGKDMNGNITAVNHCPDTWTRRHMHIGLSNTNHFYYDKGITASGDDTDPTNGIDQAMLFFYAGHGCPECWNALGNNATQQYMSIGNCPEGGLLRYYWQCSCEVFAHGPKNCPGETFDYSWLGNFDGSADSPNMRNVYERWGPVLDPDLRMAGGASTPAYCHEQQTNRIWDNYNNNSFDVADSFIDGLNWGGVVPLCITIGGSDVTSTPLYDATFTNQPNTSGTSHYHIQYLSNFASTPREPELIIHIPELLPILNVVKLPMLEQFRDLEFKIKDNWMVSTDEVGERGPRVRINRLSGAVYIIGERKLTVGEPILKEEEYIERALGFIEEQGWTERNFTEAMGSKFMIERMPVEGKGDDIQKFQKNIIVTFKRQIEVDGFLVNVLGEGGVMRVQMNNDGSVLNASKIWREIVVGIERQLPVKTYNEAYDEALKQIETPQAYKLDRWTWGYKEAAGNVEQTELKIVFQFAFVPIDPETSMKYPPQMIEILGQE